MGKQRGPEIKTGVNRGRRVHWVQCPRCGAGKDHVSRVAAKNELSEHTCDG